MYDVLKEVDGLRRVVKEAEKPESADYNSEIQRRIQENEKIKSELLEIEKREEEFYEFRWLKYF